MFLKNCANRDEDTLSNLNQIDSKNKTMKKDSILSEYDTQINDSTDPPVRDGDNWKQSIHH